MKKIDFVILWVDGNDPKWLKEKSIYENKQNNSNTEEFKNWINSKIRYRDWDNLKYWFRAVEKYAPWVNKIHFVTYGHLPEWLNTNNPKLNIVNHKDIMPKEYLPTYNTNTIELNIHNIKGLTENFVYFNDDVFINNYVKPTDFFINDLPCEIAGFDIVNTNSKIMSADINNVKILNKYFNKKEVVKKNFFKWFNIKYGKYLIKTIILMPWKDITGIAEAHVMASHKKSTYKKVWKLEYDKLHKTCLDKFRASDNVSQWLMKGYQLLSGEFYPRSSNFGKSYGKIIDQEIIDDILKHKHKAICINDVECSEESFLKQKEMLNETFEKVLPDKSSFEK